MRRLLPIYSVVVFYKPGEDSTVDQSFQIQTDDRTSGCNLLLSRGAPKVYLLNSSHCSSFIGCNFLAQLAVEIRHNLNGFNYSTIVTTPPLYCRFSLGLTVTVSNSRFETAKEVQHVRKLLPRSNYQTKCASGLHHSRIDRRSTLISSSNCPARFDI